MQQMMFFAEETQEDKLMKRLQELEDKLDRQRKSQFAKIGALSKKYDETVHELSTLKAAICKNNVA